MPFYQVGKGNQRVILMKSKFVYVSIYWKKQKIQNLGVGFLYITRVLNEINLLQEVLLRGIYINM